MRLCHRERGLPDQVVGSVRDTPGIAAGRVNDQRLARAEAAGEVYAQGKPKSVEAWPEVGARGRHPEGEPLMRGRVHIRWGRDLPGQAPPHKKAAVLRVRAAARRLMELARLADLQDVLFLGPG